MLHNKHTVDNVKHYPTNIQEICKTLPNEHTVDNEKLYLANIQ